MTGFKQTLFIALKGVIILSVLGGGMISITPGKGEAARFESDYLSVTVPDTVQFSASDTVSLALHVTLKSKWHINTGSPELDFLIPTRLTADTPLRLQKVDYPSGTPFSFAFSDRTINVYKNDLVLTALASLPGNLTQDTLTRRLTLSYQPCSRRQCLPPEKLPIPYRLKLDPERKQVLMDFQRSL